MPETMLMEDLVPLAVATRSHPATRKLNPRTLLRWSQRGVKGHRLESVQVGGKLMTSVAAITRFLEKLNPAVADQPPAVRSPRDRLLASERAAKELELAGA